MEIFYLDYLSQYIHLYIDNSSHPNPDFDFLNMFELVRIIIGNCLMYNLNRVFQL